MFGVVEFHEMIECIAAALEERDHYTEGHSLRVSDMVRAIAGKMGFSEDETRIFHFRHICMTSVKSESQILFYANQADFLTKNSQ